MKRLVFDTSTKTVLIGLMKANTWLGKWTFPDDDYQQSKTILSLIQSCLDEVDCPLKEVEEIAVGIGPGSYTGVRVGLTIAKTWAYARKVPLSTFDSRKIDLENGRILGLDQLQESDFTRHEDIINLSPVYEGDHFSNQS